MQNGIDQNAHSVYARFANDVNGFFGGNLKALFAYGSAVYGDLHTGFSDLDFFAVVSCEITQEHFDALLAYRKELRASDNKLFGMLEGEFVPERILASRQGAVAYWGTSGERMKDRYDLAGFSMRGLLESGVLIYGEDIRGAIPFSTDAEMLGQVRLLINTVRKYAAVTGADVHSADWLFLICQSLYWLITGNIASKTAAAEWAKGNFNDDWCGYLDKAIWVRKHPLEAISMEDQNWLSSLGGPIQAACDRLECEYLKRKAL